MTPSSKSTPVRVRDLRRDEFPAAVALLARGMDDNPIHMAAYRGDAASRRRAHERLVAELVRTAPRRTFLGVDRDGRLCAVAGSAPAGTCRPAPAARVLLLGAAASLGPSTAARVIRWNAAWARHDPDEPHEHLGPVAVDEGMRGQGLGSALLLEHTRRLDAIGAVGYLETDRPEAVRFYQRFGYVIVGRQRVLDVPCWFLRRPGAA